MKWKLPLVCRFIYSERTQSESGQVDGRSHLTVNLRSEEHPVSFGRRSFVFHREPTTSGASEEKQNTQFNVRFPGATDVSRLISASITSNHAVKLGLPFLRKATGTMLTNAGSRHFRAS